MYISCTSLWDAGITREKVSCCGSCHYDADEYPGQYDLVEIYADDIGVERPSDPRLEVVGSVCCAVNNYLDTLPDKVQTLKTLYEQKTEAR